MDKKAKLFYGWWIVLVAFLTIGITYGTKGAFGVIQLSMFKDLGWSRGEVAGALSANMLTYAIVVPFTGYIMDKIGVKNTLLIGGIFTGMAYYILTIVKTPLQFYIFYGLLLGAAGTCMGMVPGPTAVSRWFIKKRGRALAIALSASPLGGAVFTFLSKNWLNTVGWRGTFKIMAISSWILVIIPTLFLMKNSPEEMGLYPDGESNTLKVDNTGNTISSDEEQWSIGKILSSPMAWALFLSYFFMAGNGWAESVHQVPQLVANGLNENFAANALGFNMVLSVISMLIWPTISDFVERKTALLISLVLQICGVIFLLLAKNPAMTYLFVIVAGLSYMGSYGLFSAFAADLFGRKDLGKVNGIMATFGSLGAAVAIYLGGYIYDATKSYSLLWYICIGGLILSVLFTIYLGGLIKKYKTRKIA